MNEHSKCYDPVYQNSTTITTEEMKTTADGISDDLASQMIAAAFADANVPIDSTVHVAIQFRVSPVNQFQIGLPSQASNWIVINLKPNDVPFYHHWWFILLLGVCGTLIVLVLLSTLKWNLHKRQQFGDSQFWIRNYDKKSSPTDIVMTDCCLSLSAYPINAVATTPIPINNEFISNGICQHSSMTGSSYKRSRMSGMATTADGKYLLENSVHLLNRQQSPFNTLLSSPKWDTLYKASPEILIAPTDSTVGSKAPSNRTISTSEVERFDEVNQSNNSNAAQGVITSNPSLYREADISIHRSQHLSPFYSPEYTQPITELRNMTSNEVLMNHNLVNSPNINYPYFEQSSLPYLIPTSRQIDDLPVKNTYMYQTDVKRNLSESTESKMMLNQIVDSFQSVQHQSNPSHLNLQLHSDGGVYNVDYSSNRSQNTSQPFRNAFNCSSIEHNQSDVTGYNIDGSGDAANEQFCYPDFKNEINVMTRSQIDSYKHGNETYLKYNSLYRNNCDRNFTSNGYKRVNSIPYDMEMKPFQNECTKNTQQNNRVMVDNNINHESKQYFHLGSEASMNSDQNQIPVNKPYNNHSSIPNNYRINFTNENSLFPVTNKYVRQETLYQSVPVYGNNETYNMHNSDYLLIL
ncbi:unnamed protein product [Heterobilharzia americana]|nr:unnamed protein product [Heterobilharzia americana]